MKALFYLSVFALFVSCGPTGTDALTPSLEALKENYPIVKQYGDSLKNTLALDYKEDGMKFNVFSTPVDLYLLTVEFNGRSSAIPIMPLSDSCYWKYENHSALCGKGKNDFKSEYQRLLDDLDISDTTSSLVFLPYNIIVNNILDLAEVTWSDTTDFLQPCFFYTSIEDSTRLAKIRKTNTQQIIKLMHPSPNVYTNCAHKSYYGHVFWFDAQRTSSHEKWQLIYNSWIFSCPKVGMIGP